MHFSLIHFVQENDSEFEDVSLCVGRLLIEFGENLNLLLLYRMYQRDLMEHNRHS